MIDENISLNDHQSIGLPSMASLLAFERAAARSSFAEASRELGRTPSAVSHAIRNLELSLGFALFERAGRTIQLTEAGTKYLEAVQRSISGLRFAADQLRTRHADRVVRVSALPFFTSVILLPNLGKFEERYPDYELRLETTSSYADILNGEADVGIRFGSENSRNLICEPLIAVAGQPVASEGYLGKSPTLETLDDIGHHTLIHVRQNEAAWQRWYQAQGGGELKATNNLSFDSLLGSLDAVKRGLGIGLAMHPLIKSYPGYGTDYIPIFDSTSRQTMDYNFVCRRSAFSERKIQDTLKWLKRLMENLDTT